jgi:hypothetical protein
MTSSGLMLLTSAMEALQNFGSSILLPYVTSPFSKRKNVILKARVVSATVFFKAKDKLATIYKGREVFGVNETEGVLFGTASNKATAIIPKAVKFEVLHNVLCIADKDKVPANVAKGSVIDKTNAKISTYFLDSTTNDPIDDKDKVAIRLPVSFPLPYGDGAIVKTGSVDANTYQALDDIDPSLYLSFWAEHLNAHDPALQKLFLEEADLQAFLPPTPNLGHEYNDTAFVPYHPFDEDDAEFANEITALTSECEELVDSVNKQQSEFRSATASRSSGPPAREVATTNETACNTVAEVTMKEQVNGRILAWAATYNSATEKLTLPKLSKFIGPIRDSKSSTVRHKLTVSTIKSLVNTLADEGHHLCRQVDFPKLDKVTSAFISEANLSDEAIHSLEMNTSANGGVVIPMLMPDSASTAKTKIEQNGQVAAEAAMDEHASKRTKLSTTFTSVSDLRVTNALLGTFANIIVIALLYANFDLMDKASDVPTVVQNVLDLADIITTLRAREWMKDNADKRQQLLHWVLNQLISITNCYAEASQNVVLASFLLDGDVENAPKKEYQTAATIFDDTVSVLDRIFRNSTPIPNNALWDNSKSALDIEARKHKKLLAEIQQQVSTPRGGPGNDKSSTNDRKRGTPGGSNNNDHANKWRKTADAKGFIKCEKANNINLPTSSFNQEYKLCKPNMADGVVCSLGEQCKKDHSDLAEIAARNRTQAKELVAKVDSDPKCEFVNVDPKLLESLRN